MAIITLSDVVRSESGTIPNHQRKVANGSMASESYKRNTQQVLKTPDQPPQTSGTGITEGMVLVPRGATISVAAAERIRILRARIERLNLGKEKKHVIAVTSAIPGEGKSLCAVNLARSFGNDIHRKVLLVDCDIRRPNVHNFFGLPIGPGLSDAFLMGKPLHSVVRAVEPGMHVITAGEAEVDPVQVIEDAGFAEMLYQLKDRYEYIILDCPPVLLCPEPITLSSIAEGTLMVVRSWKTSKTLVQDAIDAIGEKRCMGLILNDAVEPTGQYNYASYYGPDRLRMRKKEHALIVAARSFGRYSKIAAANALQAIRKKKTKKAESLSKYKATEL